jgi:hypothetical protein
VLRRLGFGLSLHGGQAHVLHHGVRIHFADGIGALAFEFCFELEFPFALALAFAFAFEFELTLEFALELGLASELTQSFELQF